MESTLPRDGVILHYELHGEGPPLLLLHDGTGCHADRRAPALRQGADLLVAVRVRAAHSLPFACRLIFGSRKRGHDFAGLPWEIGCSADDHNRLEAFPSHGRHVQQDVASHADADGFAALDAEMIEQSQGVEGTVEVGKRLRQLRPIGNG